MEFEFTKNTLLGTYSVRCEMEHQILARWLEDEIGAQRTMIDQVHSFLELCAKKPMQTHWLPGREIGVSGLEHEIKVMQNSLVNDDEWLEEEGMSLYQSEGISVCGLEDFRQVFLQWCDFVAQY
ncbi:MULTISPECIES: YacL family protein [unclassified Vibrio]|uniref:YacL family protein n=1 Tax=Vibrio sp. HB236076 TaxID=3232307 RepID=A0AB39H9N3_9VIBR|nr:YacL family protein [Vibrio sp. HB161653]MDP5254026.1 YacL family protein [Vibrio sp. HB161653]